MAKRFQGFPEEGMRFLRALKRHNNREWFQERKDTYLASVRDPMNSLILALSADLQKFAPEMIANPKISAYRIYRDTRFSSNKLPYKTHTAAVFPRRGLAKHEGAGFYVHVAPDELFVGGGLFRPASEDLYALREYLSTHHASFRAKTASRQFRTLFGEIAGEQLSRVPRGFSKDHPGADLLRYKQFLASRSLDPTLAKTPEFYPEVIRTFKALLPVVRFLNEPTVARHNHLSFNDLAPHLRKRNQS